MTLILYHINGLFHYLTLLSFLDNNEDSFKSYLSSVINGASCSTSQSIMDWFNEMECNLTKIMLMVNLTTRLRKSKGYNPRNSLFDVGRGNIDGESIKNGDENRIRKCISAVMLLHSMQYNRLPEHGPASEALLNGILMIMDKKGISDSLLSTFETIGFSTNAYTESR